MRLTSRSGGVKFIAETGERRYSGVEEETLRSAARQLCRRERFSLWQNRVRGVIYEEDSLPCRWRRYLDAAGNRSTYDKSPAGKIMSGPSGKGLGVAALSALVVSAMIGGGIYSLPQNMSQSASAGAVILAWVISGIGIFFLVNTFRILAESCPEATTGIYTYARMGFGPFAGSQIAFSYWLSNIFGNVGYAVLLMDAMDYFFPGVFTGGNNLWSILGGSVIIWVMNFAVLRGVRQASSLNMIGTFCKLIPIFIFIVIMLWVFRWSTFASAFGGGAVSGMHDASHPAALGDMMEQVRSTMMVTLWSFIGIEGAVVLSGRARSQKAVGMATVIGFLCCLIIYALLSILPFGFMHQAELAKLSNPSSAPLLEAAVHGRWGGDIMNLGVVIAILTSWLAFTIMVAQIPYAAAIDGVFPAIFRRENRREAPSVSLFVTSIIMQLTMVLVYFANNAWNTMLSVTSVMILPSYLASTLFLWKLCVTGGPEERSAGAKPLGAFALFCGVAGSVYTSWMIYAAGLKYLAMAFVFQVIGIPVYVIARRRQMAHGGPVFSCQEFIAAVVITLIALGAVAAFAAGAIKL